MQISGKRQESKGKVYIQAMKEGKWGGWRDIVIMMKWKKHNWVEMRWNAFGEMGWCIVGYDVLKQRLREE